MRSPTLVWFSLLVITALVLALGFGIMMAADKQGTLPHEVVDRWLPVVLFVFVGIVIADVWAFRSACERAVDSTSSATSRKMVTWWLSLNPALRLWAEVGLNLALAIAFYLLADIVLLVACVILWR